MTVAEWIEPSLRRASPARTASYDEMLQRARDLVPALRERAERTEELRNLPPETNAELHDTGLYRMMQPTRVGGAELDYVSLVEIGAELARGCASTAWAFTNLSCHHWILAMMPKAAQDRLWGEDPDVLIASSFIFPCGKARAVKGGYQLSGRWPFSSGVGVSTWNMLGGIVADGDRPGHRVFLLPDSDYKVLDTWHAAGLKGTASNDVTCEDVFVPEEMTVAVADIKGGPTPGSAINPGPLYQLPVFALFPLILSGVTLGNAEACLDDYVASMRKRSSTYSGAKLSELQSVQIKIGAAATRTDVARRVMVDICERAMDDARRGHVPDMETKLRYRRDTAFATSFCTEAIDMLYTASGGQALYTRNALQRQFRDAHAAANHIAFNMDVATAAYGRVALGHETDNPII